MKKPSIENYYPTIEGFLAMSANVSSTTEVMVAMKEMFKNVIQQVMDYDLEKSSAAKKAKEHQMMTKQRCRKTTEMGILRI